MLRCGAIAWQSLATAQSTLMMDSCLRLFLSQLTQIVVDDVNEDEPLPEAEEGAGPLIHEDL